MIKTKFSHPKERGSGVVKKLLIPLLQHSLCDVILGEKESFRLSHPLYSVGTENYMI